MSFNPHVKLFVEDDEGNKMQVYPKTDIESLIGFGDKNGDLVDRIAKLEKKVDNLDNLVRYH